MGFIFSPHIQKKKKKDLSKPNLFVGNDSKTFPDSRKSTLEKKKVSIFFQMEDKTFEEVTAFCGGRLTKGKRLKCIERFQMFPERPFLVKQKQSSQAFPNFLLCSSVWERKCLEISVLLADRKGPVSSAPCPELPGSRNAWVRLGARPSSASSSRNSLQAGEGLQGTGVGVS